MPTTDAFMIAAIVLMFIVFGAALAWADYQTRNVRQRSRQGVADVAQKAGATTTIQAQARPAQHKEFDAAVR